MQILESPKSKSADTKESPPIDSKEKTKQPQHKSPKSDRNKSEERPRTGRKRKGDESYVDALTNAKSSRNASPSYHRLSQVAERLSKTSPHQRLQEKSKRESSPYAKAKFSPGPFSSNSESGDENVSEKMKEKPVFGSSIKPGASDVNITSKPIMKGIFTKKSPLMPVTFSKSHVYTKFLPKKIKSAVDKPKGIVEPIPKTFDDYGGPRKKSLGDEWSSDEDKNNVNNNKNKSDKNECKDKPNERSKKQKSPSLKKTPKDDYGWYYDDKDETISNNKSYISHKHVPRPVNKFTPVKEFSFKVGLIVNTRDYSVFRLATVITEVTPCIFRINKARLFLFLDCVT